MSNPSSQSQPTNSAPIEMITFSNQTRQDKKLLKKFVQFHWQHYRNEPQYIPLLDYEYLGFKLLGIHGFFEPDNLFAQHAEMAFFLALRQNEVVGRCNAFVNHNHNRHWQDQVGFFGQFETIDDPEVAKKLLQAAESWLKSKGMNTIRGPQNLPVNEATPGLLTKGFASRPVVYYHYNKSYYEKLLLQAGYQPVKHVLSWEAPINIPEQVEAQLAQVGKGVMARFHVKVETWDERPLSVRKQEMFDIYNNAWNDNFGFVPFTEEEFYTIIDDMQLIMDKGLFIFVYVEDKPVAFFGGVPNVAEVMTPIAGLRHCELLRAVKLLLTKGRVKGFRLGYLGIKKDYRKLGLTPLMLWQQKIYAQKKGYEYCDLGWVLEDNIDVIRFLELIPVQPSKTYTIFQKPIG